jgi:hypothetical protein
MVLRLARALDVPIRERNQLLLAAGYAPFYRDAGLDGAQAAQVRAALGRMLGTASGDSELKTAGLPSVVVRISKECWSP